ncbi:MAG: FAD-dependent oxidoreductase [Kiritimatiellae bacterium]|nr:FAD-dependent oxidoreductase [Kiritimatiellia bacterium]
MIAFGLVSFFAVGSVFSATEPPLFADVDVVVVGGSAAGVAAAEEAARHGASVCLLAPRPFLGEDLAATYRLVREDGSEDSLFREIFSRDHLPLSSSPFSYRYLPGNAPTADDGGRLNDGLASDLARDGIEFKNDAVVVADLGKETEIQEVEMSLFRLLRPAASWRPVPKNGYNSKGMRVVTSMDGKKWHNHTSATGRGGHLVAVFPKPVRCRYVKLRVEHDTSYPRQMLGDLTIRIPDSGGERFAPYTTPLKIKRALDRCLIAAKVRVLTGIPVCDVLRDEAGRFAGILFAGRGGLQAVRAKVLVDATERAWAAQCAGGRHQPFAPGKARWQRIVFSPDAPVADGLSVRDLGICIPVTMARHGERSAPVQARFWKCEKEIALSDDSPLTLAEADAQLRDATFTERQVDMADTCWFTPPDPFELAATGELAAYRPAGTEAVFVSGPRAAIPRNQVEKDRALGGQLALGRRLGDAAASLARTLPKPGTAKPTVAQLPVFGTFDTVVAGGGTGGAPAGIAAARQGLKTAVCEFTAVLGGQTTEGRIPGYYFGNICGFTKEIDKGANRFAAIKSQGKAEWYRQEIRRAGGTTCFTTMATGVTKDGNRLTGVEVVFSDGRRGVLRCQLAIDATGNADLAAAAGEETEFISGEELSVQGAGVARRIPGSSSSNCDIGFVDETDVCDLAQFFLRARLSVPRDTWDVAQLIGSRERRRLKGVFYMTPQDVMAERKYPDVVARTRSNFDTHGQTADRQFFIEDPVHTPMYVNLPYRCMLPRNTDGLLVIGLGMSAHRDAMPILRMVADIQNQGYVAGAAAAFAVRSKCPPRNIDVKALQRHLVEKEILPSEALTWRDSFPIPDAVFDRAVQTLPDKYSGLNTLLTDVSRAVPKLRNAFARATDAEAKFVYAHVLALLGNADGAAMLIDRLTQSPAWDKGWNYKGMSQFNRSVSWMDSYIIALGYARARDAVPTICETADRLTADDAYSHFRAVAKALEAIGDKRGIPALSRCLRMPGVGGYARTPETIAPLPAYENSIADRERTLMLREICLARALYRLGDDTEHLGEKTLRAYAADPRRAFAHHAKLVLGEP